MTDIEKYHVLISDAKKYYKSKAPELKSIIKDGKLFDLTWCLGLDNEINIWSYWQGGKRGNDNMSAEILLVGQDYGNVIKDGKLIPIIEKYVNSNGHMTDIYVEEIKKDKKNHTDNNLLYAFSLLGEKYRADIPNERLFFTNLCLGYRSSESISGGSLSAHMSHDSIYLKRLVDILKPKLVICLGVATFVSAVTGLLTKEEFEKNRLFVENFVSDFNSAIDSGKNHIKIKKNDFEYECFGISHPGFMGVINRLKNFKKKGIEKTKEEMLADDWNVIKEYL